MQKAPLLSQLTDEQLVDEFNQSVSVVAPLVLEDSYVKTMAAEFKIRGVNYARLGDITKESFRFGVVLFGQNLYRVIDLPGSLVNVLLICYLVEHHPDEMQFNPAVLKYSNKEIVYGHTTKPGRFRLDTNDVLKSITPKI
jgi:hypothetical protein